MPQKQQFEYVLVQSDVFTKKHSPSVTSYNLNCGQDSKVLQKHGLQTSNMQRQIPAQMHLLTKKTTRGFEEDLIHLSFK